MTSSRLLIGLLQPLLALLLLAGVPTVQGSHGPRLQLVEAATEIAVLHRGAALAGALEEAPEGERVDGAPGDGPAVIIASRPGLVVDAAALLAIARGYTATAPPAVWPPAAPPTGPPSLV